MVQLKSFERNPCPLGLPDMLTVTHVEPRAGTFPRLGGKVVAAEASSMHPMRTSCLPSSPKCLHVNLDVMNKAGWATGSDATIMGYLHEDPNRDH